MLIVEEGCPADAVCIDIAGAVDISNWAAAVERMYEAIKACPGVEFALPPLPSLPYKPVPVSMKEWEDRQWAAIEADLHP